MDTDNTFGGWLRRRRRQLDLTQTQLAECALCSPISIRKFENGERRPSRELAELLARCLNVPEHERDSFTRFARGLQPDFGPGEAENLPPAIAHTVQFPALPIPPTPFVGRKTELAMITTQLADPTCRLLTLVGPGGIGKTRLGLATAASQQDRFSDGVAFVPLSTVTDPASFPPTIAHSLGIPLTGSSNPADQLAHILRDKEMLLVLDNFEQLLEGADLLAVWLRQAPKTKWLITSRERLNIVEEWLFPVQGFSGLEPGVALFEQSARRVRPDFALDGLQEVVSHICDYVGGMPLAIELAAGWTAILTCEQILAQMQKTFDFLSTSLRNIPQRHRSLRHLFDQSWDLLTPSEQIVLAKLTVFRGGFSLTEAESVTSASLSILLSLSNKSLIHADRQGRYDFHELIREYGSEKLRSTGLEEETRFQHLQVFSNLAKSAKPHLHGPDAIGWFKRLDDEQDNFLASLEVGGSAEFVLDLVNNLWWFWLRRGYWRQAEKSIQSVVAQASKVDSPGRCLALLYLSNTRSLQGRYGEAAPHLLEAVAMARRLNHAECLAATLAILGQATPDIHEGLGILMEAKNQREKYDDPAQFWELARLSNIIGERLHTNGSYEEAESYYQRSLNLYQQGGDIDHIAYPLGNMGRLAIQKNQIAMAYNLISESVGLSRAIGHYHGLSDWLIYLGKVTLYLGDLPEAESTLQEARLLHFELNNPRGLGYALSYLALTALIQDNIEVAIQYSQHAKTLYQRVWQQSHEADMALASNVSHISPDFVDFTFISFLVVAAQGYQERAVSMFALAQHFQKSIGYEPDPLLKEKINQAMESLVAKKPVSVLEEALDITDPSIDKFFALMNNFSNQVKT